jgi:hypothetical protein
MRTCYKSPACPHASPVMTDEEFEARAHHLRRRAGASHAAYRLHQQRPELAREAGSKGGAKRGAQLAGNSGYMRWVARRRWYGRLAGPAPLANGRQEAHDAS